MEKFNDVILRQMYLEYDIPCDRLVSNPEKITSFAQDYTKRSGQSVELSKLAHHMLNLRRRGQARGGFARLRHAYNGRN